MQRGKSETDKFLQQLENQGQELPKVPAWENCITDLLWSTETPLHLVSGQADVNIDAEIVHDAFGLPYFPAKRFKGLLYESAVEVIEKLG